jgi:hypothetical protein
MESVTERFVWGCVRSTPGADVSGMVARGVSFGLRPAAAELGLRLYEAPDGLWIFSGLERPCDGQDAHGCEGAAPVAACATSAPAWARCWPRGRVGLLTRVRGELRAAHAGVCAPHGGGYLACDGRQIVRRRRGRPRASTLRASVSALWVFVRHVGGLRRASKALGISRESARHYLKGRGVPPGVAARLAPEPTRGPSAPACAAPGASEVLMGAPASHGRVLGAVSCRDGGAS